MGQKNFIFALTTAVLLAFFFIPQNGNAILIDHDITPLFKNSFHEDSLEFADKRQRLTSALFLSQNCEKDIPMTPSEDNKSVSIPKPIEAMYQLSPGQLRSLKSRWIDTIEGFVGAAATSEGRAGMCEALSIDQEKLDELLHNARQMLGDARYNELVVPTPGGPTGALFEEDPEQPGDGEAK